eukprot:325028-Prorocentrum_minimum.AAC.1
MRRVEVLDRCSTRPTLGHFTPASLAGSECTLGHSECILGHTHLAGWGAGPLAGAGAGLHLPPHVRVDHRLRVHVVRQ